MNQTNINIYSKETHLISDSSLYILKKHHNTYYKNINHVYLKAVIKIKTFSNQNIEN